MTVRLQDILGPIDDGQIDLRGRTIKLRAVRAAEELELQRQDPPPVATTDNLLTEQYELDKAQHQMRRKAAIFGIAAGIENDAGEVWSPSRSRAWVKAWATKIAEEMTDGELADAYITVKTIGVVLPKELQRVQDRIGSGATPGN